MGHRAYECYRRQGAMSGHGSVGGVGSHTRGGHGGGNYGRGGYGGYGSRGNFGGSYVGNRGGGSYGGSYGGRAYGGERRFNNQGGKGQTSVVQGGGNNRKSGAVSEASKRAKTSGKIFTMGQEKNVEENQVVTGIFSIHSTPTYILFDSGASNSFVYSSHVLKMGSGDVCEHR